MDRTSSPEEDARRGVASIALLCDLAEDLGHPSSGLLGAAGVSPEALEDPATTVTTGQELAAIAALLDHGGEEDAAGLGLEAGRRYRLTTYGIWSYALLSSATFRDALSVALGHVGLTFACTTINVTETADSLRFSFLDWPLRESLRRFVGVRDTIAGVEIIRGVLDRDVTPRQIELAIPEPPDPAPFRRAYGGEVDFGATTSTLTFEASLLDLPMPQASELTARMCLEQCRELLDARRARRGLSGEVRDRLVSSPGSIPDQEGVATGLHMSVRNLRRRLRAEGVSFRELVDQTRRTLAEDLLMTGQLTVDQVAYRVGYRDTSAFIHAFRRWNDDAPKRWARRQQEKRASL